MPNWWINVCAAMVNLILFVGITETFVHRRAIPVYFRTGKYRRFAVAMLLCGSVNAALTLVATWSIVQPFSNSWLTDLFWSWENLIYGNFFVYTAFAAMSVATKLLFDWYRVQQQIEELAKEKTKAELESLKAQLNPHFLFNSLNSIYGRIDKRNTEARNLLLRFSDLLRYQLYECQVDLIAIEKEVEYLQTFVAVQRERKSERIKIELKLVGRLSGYRIAPLLFVPFVENAFKYVSNHERAENFLMIELEGRGNALSFKCVNTIEPNFAARAAPEINFYVGGIGLANVMRRLELIYPNRHRLDRRADDNVFSVELVIEPLE